MTCSPEQSRLNAHKSTGPKTQRGKAIVSQNSRKHGLLSQRPPLLMTEDVDRFRTLQQELVDYYQPEGPVENHLVQQIAMAMQKQQRIWEAEVAEHNAQLLPDPLPVKNGLPLTQKQANQMEPEQLQYLEALGREQKHLQHLFDALNEDCVPQSRDQFQAERDAMSLEELTNEREEAETEDWLDTWPLTWEESVYFCAHHCQQHFQVFKDEYPLDALPEQLPSMEALSLLFLKSAELEKRYAAVQFAKQKLLKERHPYALLERVLLQANELVKKWDESENPYRLIKRTKLKRLRVSVDQDAQRILETWQSHPAAWWVINSAEWFAERMTVLKQAVEAKLGEHRSLMANLQAAQQVEQERREWQKQSLPESLKLISRYEAHNNRQLHQALNQLTELQNARKNEGSMALDRKKRLKAI